MFPQEYPCLLHLTVSIVIAGTTLLTPTRNQGRRHRHSYNYCCYSALTFDGMHHILGNVMPSDRTAKRGSALDEYF